LKTPDTIKILQRMGPVAFGGENAMKAVFRWICDPTVDLLLIGVLLVQFAAFGGGDPEIPDGELQAALCPHCGCPHEEHPSCPALQAMTAPFALLDED
jgi:hypothetical protein